MLFQLILRVYFSLLARLFDSQPPAIISYRGDDDSGVSLSLETVGIAAAVIVLIGILTAAVIPEMKSLIARVFVEAGKIFR